MSVSTSTSARLPQAKAHLFHPLNVIYCDGPVTFRSQAARDVACLLDVDETVSSWACLPTTLHRGRDLHRPDFLVVSDNEHTLVDVVADVEPPNWVEQAASVGGFRYQAVEAIKLPNVRLKNAKDLLRYAHHDVALGDRVRLLAALDENSSLTVAEALTVFREVRPMAGLASMVLQRFITMDLDESLIGPETLVRRKRD